MSDALLTVGTLYELRSHLLQQQAVRKQNESLE